MGIERTTLQTSDGVALEAELNLPAEHWAATALAHPHPEHGGSMHAPLIESLFEALPAEGIAALRFNFRGVGSSGGAHGGGRDERRDVEAAVAAIAALAALAGTVADAPLVVAGWSFGADVSLCVTDERIAAWFAMAPPMRSVRAEDMAAATDLRPKLLAVPEHDQFCPPDAARAAVRAWSATSVEVVPATDHFFLGGARRARELCVELLRSLATARR